MNVCFYHNFKINNHFVIPKESKVLLIVDIQFCFIHFSSIKNILFS